MARRPRRTGVFKKSNEYAEAVSSDAYESIPKAVWAALAVSALTCGGDLLGEAERLVIEEWQTLHLNGIVPQAPPARFLKAASLDTERELGQPAVREVESVMTPDGEVKPGQVVTVNTMIGATEGKVSRIWVDDTDGLIIDVVANEGSGEFVIHARSNWIRL